MKSTREAVQELRREVRRQRVWIEVLSKALLTHARTDLAPDAALPELRALVRRIKRAPGGSP